MSHTLTHTQVQLAHDIAEVIDGEEFHDAFVAAISAIAMAIVEGAPNREEAVVAARQFGDALEETVESGMAHKLPIIGGYRQ